MEVELKWERWKMTLEEGRLEQARWPSPSSTVMTVEPRAKEPGTVKGTAPVISGNS